MKVLKPKASIILSTYEWPEALAMVMSGLHQQSEKNFEVMIADDGSSSDTKATIVAYRSLRKLEIQHFWQEHKGFRKSRILNEAIRAARGDVLIFLDGDCVPHRDFVKYHLELCDSSHYVAGRRLDLSAEFTKMLTADRIEQGFLNSQVKGFFTLWKDSLRKKGSKPFHRSFLLKNSLLRKIMKMDHVVDLKGCNFSVLREKMLAIGGFDESYEGYGREDTDVELRLQNLGLKIRSAKNLCLQYHLWHQPRGFTPVNEELLENVRRTKRVKALKGIES